LKLRQSEKFAGRRPIRFSPDLNALAWIKFPSGTDKALPEIVALVQNESFSGCCLIGCTDRPVNVGDLLILRVGRLQAMAAKVAWVKVLDDGILRIGFLYTDEAQK
jgi:hypothetical protein